VALTGVLVSQAANSLRQLLTAAQQEVDDCPRLFTLTPEQKGKGKGKGLFEQHYRLVLWCEYPGGPHPLTDRPYSVGQPREWFIRVRPYMAVMVKALQILVPALGAASTLLLPGAQLNAVQVDLDVMRELVRDADGLSLRPGAAGELDGLAGNGRDAPGGPLTRAEGEALRSVRQLIFEHDRARHFAGLRRWLTASGDFLWLCPHHYTEYDQGLPQLPPGREPAKDDR
jgi:internalin A